MTKRARCSGLNHRPVASREPQETGNQEWANGRFTSRQEPTKDKRMKQVRRTTEHNAFAERFVLALSLLFSGCGSGSSRLATPVHAGAPVVSPVVLDMPPWSPRRERAAATLVTASTVEQGPTQVVTAETDAAQVRHGIGEAPTEKPQWCGEALGNDVRCRALAHGPLFLTHLVVAAPGCAGQSIAVIRHGKAWLHFENTQALSHTRIFIGRYDTLVLVRRQQAKAAESGSAPVEEKEPAVIELQDHVPVSSCKVYWGGFAPYASPHLSVTESQLLLDY